MLTEFNQLCTSVFVEMVRWLNIRAGMISLPGSTMTASQLISDFALILLFGYKLAETKVNASLLQ